MASATNTNTVTDRPPASGRALLIDLRAGEGAEVALSFATLFGVVAALSLLETARDTLFLAKLPAHRLALVYVVVAALGLFVTGRNLELVRRFGRRNSLVVTLAGAAVGTTLLYFRPASPVLAFTLYVWSALLGSVAVVQFWLVAGESFTSAQSKRLYPVISAGGVVGALAGSGLAILLLGYLPVGSLLLAAAITLVVTAVVVTLAPDRTDAPTPALRAGGPVAAPGRVTLLRQDPYLTRVAALVVLSTLALLVLDYFFKSRAAASLSAGELGPFFARYYAVLNALSLVMQVVFASRLVRRLGVTAALVLLPLALVIGAAGSLFLASSFLVVLLAKGADGALRHSVHRVGSELLYVPLQGALRDRVKPLIDSVLARVAQAAAAAGILGLVALELDSPRALAAILAVLAGAWIGVAISLRGPYLEAFRSSLARGGLDDPRIGFDDLDLSSVETVTEALSSPDATRVIAAMNLLADAGRTRLIPALILYHEAEPVLERALAILPEPRRNDWVPLTERLLGHASEVVRLAAVRALARHGKLDPRGKPATGVVRAYLAVQRLRNADTLQPLADDDVRGIIDGTTPECEAARQAILDAVVDQPGPRWVEVILALAKLEGPHQDTALPAAMAAVKDESFIGLLIERLPVRRGRAATREALASFEGAALDRLGAALVDADLSFRVRLQVPRAIAELGSQPAADVLTRALSADVSGLLRYRVLRALGHLVTHHGARVDAAAVDAELRRNLREFLSRAGQLAPFQQGPLPSGRAQASARLVIGLLKDKMRQARERVFRLLQLQYRAEDLRTVHLALQSADKRVRANALEFVDTLTLRAEEDLRAMLRLVADDLPPDQTAARAGAWVGQPPADVETVLAELMTDSDDSLATVVAYHARALGGGALVLEAEQVMSQRGWMGLDRELGIELGGLNGA